MLNVASLSYPIQPTWVKNYPEIEKAIWEDYEIQTKAFKEAYILINKIREYTLFDNILSIVSDVMNNIDLDKYMPEDITVQEKEIIRDIKKDIIRVITKDPQKLYVYDEEIFRLISNKKNSLVNLLENGMEFIDYFENEMNDKTDECESIFMTQFDMLINTLFYNIIIGNIRIDINNDSQIKSLCFINGFIRKVLKNGYMDSDIRAMISKYNETYKNDNSQYSLKGAYDLGSPDTKKQHD